MDSRSLITSALLLVIAIVSCLNATYSYYHREPSEPSRGNYRRRYYNSQPRRVPYYTLPHPAPRPYRYRPENTPSPQYHRPSPTTVAPRAPRYRPQQRPATVTNNDRCWIKEPAKCDQNSPYRTIDGSCNNLQNPTWGQSVRTIGRRLPPQYNPGSRNDMRTIGVTGRPLPSAREVSTGLHQIATERDLSKTLTAMHMTWGQFIDHDMTHVPLPPKITCCDLPEGSRNSECIPISIPRNDEFFGPSGRTCMELRRSIAIKPGQCGNENREQLNNLTSYIDGGLVYGSTEERAHQLRAYRRGEMTDSDARYHLPVDKLGTKCDIPPVNHPDKRCFAAGDKRSNEWGGLTSLHVAFIRQHNRIANIFYRQLRQARPHMTETNLDERIYQEVRKIIGAFLQVINYGEYLPNVLGREQMRKWRLNLQYKHPYAPKHTYNPQLNPTSTNVFGTAAFRFGHSEVAFGTQPKTSTYQNASRFVTFTELFNQPTTYRQYNNDNIVRGMLREPSLRVSKFSPEIRNRLFERTFNGSGLDLPAVSTQRGREHGLPPYNAWRRFCGLPTVTFNIMPDHAVDLRRKFASIYDHHDDIDLFPAAITENFVTPDAHVGPTFACLLGQEFQRLKEGDRFWFESQGTYSNSFSNDQIRQLSKITLSKVICETTANTDWIPANAFRLDSNFVRCRDLPGLNLDNWLSLSP